MADPRGSNGDAPARLQEALGHLNAHRPDAALDILRPLFDGQPDSFDALNLAGVAATRLARYDEAIALLNRAVALRPDHAGVFNNLGIAFRAAGRAEEAVSAYRRATELQPDYAPAHGNLGGLLAGLHQHEQALVHLDRSLALRPDHVDTLLQRAYSLRRMRRSADALETADRALGIAPKHVEAHMMRAEALQDLNRFDAALAAREQALLIAPERVEIAGAVLRARMRICDWTDFAPTRDRIAAGILAGGEAINTFASLLIFDDPMVLRAAAERKAAEFQVQASAVPAVPRSDVRPHVAYFSADFRAHASMHLMKEVFERHDRSRFRISAFGFNIGTEDEYTAHVRRHVDEYFDLDGLSDAEAANLAQRNGVDIALDLKGYTQGGRTGIFARRAAPVQVSYFGFPGTMGAPFIDYMVADRTVVPAEATSGYSEKMLWMPHSYYPKDTTVDLSAIDASRTAEALPDGAIVFSSFNQATKILPDTFSDWMAILRGVPQSVLWLLDDNSFATSNLQGAAAASGVDPSRVIFAKKRPQLEHLRRLSLADLCLDTLPYNAHTTANDSLFMGVPIITLPGRTFAGRVCASLLDAVGMPELIVSDRRAYVELAVELGRQPYRLAELSGRLRALRRTSPLYDMAGYTRHLEQGFSMMLARHHAGLPPDHLSIPA